MSTDVDIGKLALSIMEHPELIERIRSLADNGTGGETQSTDGRTEVKKEPSSGGRKKRTALLCSLKPYLNDKRRSAIDTIITVLDVIDAVSDK